MRRLVVVALLLTFGCSDSADRTASTDPTESTPTASADTPAPTATTDPADDEPLTSEPPTIELPDGEPIVDGVANSLIIVHDRDGGADGLASYRADGTLVATYSDDADDSIWQPIWSPDGRRVAWTQSVEDGAWQLVTSAVDGGDRTTHALPGRPDYISYDPTSSRVLALTPSTEGFGLVIVEVARTDTPFTVVDLGRPYFSDFAPDGTRLIAHVAADMRIVGIDGEREPLDVVSITHQTPAWHPTENRVFYTTDTGDGPRIVSHDLDTGVVTELVDAADFVFFDLDPTGERLAISAFDGGATGGGLDALRRAPDQDLGTGVWIVDADDGTTTLLSSRPASSPMWDPTGSKVLVRDGLAGPGTWRVYDTEGNVGATLEVDVDGSLLPAYLPFWDQYERSQTLWSPDGRSFVHAGASTDGTEGIWVHDAATTGPSSLLVAGDVAFWSPT